MNKFFFDPEWFKVINALKNGEANTIEIYGQKFVTMKKEYFDILVPLQHQKETPIP